MRKKGKLSDMYATFSKKCKLEINFIGKVVATVTHVSLFVLHHFYSPLEGVRPGL